MTKFYVGQKVLVKDCSCGKIPEVNEMLGKICEIRSVGNDIMVYQEDKKRAWHFLPDDLEPITEPPKEITLNGATYVLKEERKPEHEWKFGDVVENEGKRYMLIKEYGLEDHVSNGTNARHLKVVDFETKNVKSIPKAHTKFLRRTDFSV